MKDIGIMVGSYLLPNLIGYRTSMFHKRERKTRPQYGSEIGFVYKFPNGQKKTHWALGNELTKKEFNNLPKRIETAA